MSDAIAECLELVDSDALQPEHQDGAASALRLRKLLVQIHDMWIAAQCATGGSSVEEAELVAQLSQAKLAASLASAAADRRERELQAAVAQLEAGMSALEDQVAGVAKSSATRTKYLQFSHMAYHQYIDRQVPAGGGCFWGDGGGGSVAPTSGNATEGIAMLQSPRVEALNPANPGPGGDDKGASEAAGAADRRAVPRLAGLDDILNELEHKYKNRYANSGDHHQDKLRAVSEAAHVREAAPHQSLALPLRSGGDEAMAQASARTQESPRPWCGVACPSASSSRAPSPAGLQSRAL